MNYNIIILVCIGLLSFRDVFSADDFYPFWQRFEPHRTTQVMVHRGVKDAAPENSMHAVQLAHRMGFEWVEVDVRLTKDGHHVILHDDTLDRTTNGSGLVIDHTLAEFQELDAGNWFAGRFAGIKVLTLAELFDLSKKNNVLSIGFSMPKYLDYATKQGINLYLDCKDINPRLLVEEILEHGMENQVAVFDDLETLKTIDRLAEGKIALMAKYNPLDGLDTFFDTEIVDVVEGDFDVFNGVKTAATHERKVWVQAKMLGGFDVPLLYKSAFQRKYDFIQTDYPASVQAAYFAKQMGNRPRTMIAAHRGVSILCPENTLSAIEMAAQLGCDYVEIDVRTTKDGQMVLMHDSNAKRTTGIDKPVHEITYDELKKVSAGEWFARKDKDEFVPTLEEALLVAKDRINIYLDNKETDPQQLVSTLKKMSIIDDTVIYGGVDELEIIHRIEPKVKLMPGLSLMEDIEKITERFQPYAFDVRWSSLSPELIEVCHAKKIKVFSDGFGENESIEEYSKAIKWGIDLIQTDNPILLQRSIEMVQNNL